MTAPDYPTPDVLLARVCAMVESGKPIGHQPGTVVWHLAELVARGLACMGKKGWELTEAGARLVEKHEVTK